MAQSIEDKIRRLNIRRKGLDRLSDLPFNDQQTILAKSAIAESWEKRQASNKHTQYALGAMQSVGSEYTEITLETANRVGKQLRSNLSKEIDARLQGSVPLDVHIRGVSDVDLLILDRSFFVFDPHGRLANTYAPSSLDRLDVILGLRTEAEGILKKAYPAVKVDCSGGKAINLTGGSLPRPVDVVPSIWYKTAEYQSSLAEHDAGVMIADKAVPTTLDNRPFLHIKNVNDADMQCNGGLKKAIRLAKNIKADSVRTGIEALSSFDIASLIYHADRRALALGQFYELSVLEELRRFLDWVYHHEVEAESLRTPDGSRVILNSGKKFMAARLLSHEVDDLAKRVAAEQQTLVEESDWTALSKVLRETQVK